MRPVRSSGPRPRTAFRLRAGTLRAGLVSVAALALVLSGCGSIATDIGASGDEDLATGVPTVLVMDASASMLTEDAPGPRIDAARTAARGLVTALPDDAVLGLVTYGTSTDDAPGSQTAGCQDVTALAGPAGLAEGGHRDALTQHIDGLSPRGYTPIAESLRRAADLLPEGETAVIVISDGEDSCGDPPCEAAAELREQHPGLAISTVGFKTATPELACIARTTDGLFVTADDADQLASRLLAAREVARNVSTLTPTGLGGIDVGSQYDDIVRTHPGFPAQSAGIADGENVVISFADCDYVFDQAGSVVEVRPQSGRTVDGLAVGDPLSRATELYGGAVAGPSAPADGAGAETRYFTASREAGTAWKITTDDDTITSIVLCRCLPDTSESSASGGGATKTDSLESTTTSGQTEIVTYRPFLDDGSLRPQIPIARHDPAEYGCRPTGEFYTCGQYRTDLSYFLCTIGPGDRPVCPTFVDGELQFVVGGPVQMMASNGFEILPTSGPVPVRVYTGDGRQCRIGFIPGGGRAGYASGYQCGDGSKLWHREGAAAFDTSGATWTAQAGNMNASDLATVSVTRVELIDR